MKLHHNFRLLENQISVKYRKWHVWQRSQIFVLSFQAKFHIEIEVKSVYLKDFQPYYITLESKLNTNLFQLCFYVAPFLNIVDFLKVSSWETPCIRPCLCGTTQRHCNFKSRRLPSPRLSACLSVRSCVQIFGDYSWLIFT